MLEDDIGQNLFDYGHHFYRLATLYPDGPELLQEAFGRYALGANVLETDVLPLSYREKSGAWSYTRLLKPDADPTDPEQVLKDQFLHFHGGTGYVLPLVLLLALSGLMLAFSGLWLEFRISRKNSLRNKEWSTSNNLLMCGAVSSIIREARMLEGTANDSLFSKSFQ